MKSLKESLICELSSDLLDRAADKALGHRKDAFKKAAGNARKREIEQLSNNDDFFNNLSLEQFGFNKTGETPFTNKVGLSQCWESDKIKNLELHIAILEKNGKFFIDEIYVKFNSRNICGISNDDTGKTHYYTSLRNDRNVLATITKVVKYYENETGCNFDFDKNRLIY